MKRDSPKQTLILCAFGLIPVVWAALLAAPAVSGGLLEILTGLTAAMNNPFAITWCEDSVKTILVFIAAYAMGIGIYFSTRRNTRPKEEHGSAKWGESATVNKKSRTNGFARINC